MGRIKELSSFDIGDQIAVRLHNTCPPDMIGIGRVVEVSDYGFGGVVNEIGRNINIGAGSGSSHITSTGKFTLTRKGDRIEVKGMVVHVWTDEGYNFDIGKSFGVESKKLERAGRAKSFKWRSTWEDRIEGELEIDRSPVRGG